MSVASAPLATQTPSGPTQVTPQGLATTGVPASTTPPPESTPTQYLPTQLLADQDGDLLPDRLERVLMLDPANADSDGDGFGDFQAALAFGEDPATVTVGSGTTGNRMRVTAHSEIEQGRAILWVDTLIQVQDRNLHPTISSFAPSLVVPGGLSIPLSGYLAGASWEMASRYDSHNGTSCRLSFRFEDEALLSALNWFTLVVDAELDGVPERTGAHLEPTQAGLAYFVPIGSGDLTPQPTNFDEQGDPFWTRGRFCKLRLSTIAQSPAGTLVEVVAADCVQSQQEAVCPATCGQSLGRVLFFPDMLRLITGS